MTNNEILSQVEQNLIHHSDLLAQDVAASLGYLFEHSLDYADLYFQSSVHESWVLEDGLVKDGSFNIERGVGVRAITGEKAGFAYADTISAAALKQAASAARGIAAHGQHGSVQAFRRSANSAIYLPCEPLQSMDNTAKVALLHQVEAFIRTLDSRAEQVMVSLTGVYEEMLVAASDGTYAADIRPLVRLNCSVLLQQDGRRERGSSGGGGRTDYGYFTETVNDEARWMQYAREAVRQAQVNLLAVDAPAGTMPVVLGAGWPGVLLHEAVGHGLEGDFNRKGASTFSGRIGEQVASKHCTIVDDGTLSGRRGSLNIDDEGCVSQCNMLIENGILKGYIQDKHNAMLMQVPPTGNGRRESFAHLPMPRMTNTYMLAGEHSPEEIIASVKKGIYAPNFGGGQVDITSGKFVFSASEAYLIENGKITTPIKGATLIGNGPDAMQQVSMVGNDLKLDSGVGVCGKQGQSVPVGVGQPTLKLDAMTVGGTA